MTWVFNSSRGTISRSGLFISNAYSGNGDGKNNPALAHKRAVGPIPVGRWRMGRVYNSANIGPFAITLEPSKDTETFGRSAFRIHGDSRERPGTASKGCIVVSRPIREMMWNSGDHDLEVIAFS